MKKHSIVVLFIFGLLNLTSASSDEFADFRQQTHQQYQQQQGEFTQFQKGLDEEYSRYQRELTQAFHDYQKAAAQIWGKENAIVPEQNRWVEYSNDMRSRSVIDFEKGLVRVEIVLDQKADMEQENKRLAALLSKALSAPPDHRSIIEIAKHPERPPTQIPKQPAMLEKQIEMQNGKLLTDKDLAAFSRKKTAEAQTHQQRGRDGTTRTILSAEVLLVPDHIKRRAERYHSHVTLYANQFSLAPPLIYAVIETESFFNPSARSHVPAFGLMQLVPKSGARDAYQYLYKKDKLVSETYLYNPRNNIELGSAYLSKLTSTYMRDITDQTSRLWCAIAAYNTGPGNVYRTFAGKYNRHHHSSRSEWRNAAMKKINTMSSEQVFQYLVANLPYKETQNYLVKVRDRMPKYNQL